MTIAQPSRRREPAIALPASRRHAHLRTVIGISAASVLISELITYILVRILIGGFVVEGMAIALVCSAPISAWIADRQLRMRYLIADQHDRMAALNVELNARNADLDAFARTVAHDLKIPLAGIVGFAELLNGDPRLSAIDGAGQSVQSIVQAGDRATEIIDGLLLLHGITHDHRELSNVDSAAAVDAALETVEVAGNNGFMITRSGTFPMVRAHHPWLVQVWVNLIGNAIKYGGSPPKVCVAAETLPGGMARFEVTDNGSGIDPRDQPRIFHEYQRLEAADAEGHGIGLAIVERVVSRLGGSVGVDTAAGGGSVFWFTVPTAAESSP